MAPTPKPPGQRRRRNAGQASWTKLPAVGRSGTVPALPDSEWLDSTRAWWATLWRSPMAVAWEDADVDSLVRLARLRDDFRRGDLPVSALGAIQQLEDRFGLSPKARRALQWEVSREAGVSTQAASEVRTLRAVESA